MPDRAFARQVRNAVGAGCRRPNSGPARDAPVSVQVNFLVFDRPPEPFDKDVVAPRPLASPRCRNPRAGLQQLLLPLLDLVRMDVELLGEFRQRLVSTDGRQRHLRLKSRTMVPAWLSRHASSSLTAMMPLVSRNVTYPPCSDFPSHLSLFISLILGKKKRLGFWGSRPKTRRLATHPRRYG